jgi:hypothetical protein
VRGYLRPSGHRRLRLTVALPRQLRHGRLAVWVDGRRVRATRRGGVVRFGLHARAGRAVDWAVTS